MWCNRPCVRGDEHESPVSSRLFDGSSDQPSSGTGQCWCVGRDVMNDRHDDTEVRRVAEEHRISAEGARNEAEQFRRLAEEVRAVRDNHREALETIRQEREQGRNAAEAARVATEEARSAAETARAAGRRYGLPPMRRGKPSWMPCARPPMR